MTPFCVLTTADDFPTIEKATFDWFNRPMNLVSIDHHNWRVCLPDETPYGTVLSFYVVRQGTRFRLEARQVPHPAIVHRKLKRGE